MVAGDMVDKLETSHLEIEDAVKKRLLHKIEHGLFAINSHYMARTLCIADCHSSKYRINLSNHQVARSCRDYNTKENYDLIGQSSMVE